MSVIKKEDFLSTLEDSFMCVINDYYLALIQNLIKLMSNKVHSPAQSYLLIKVVVSYPYSNKTF